MWWIYHFHHCHQSFYFIILTWPPLSLHTHTKDIIFDVKLSMVRNENIRPNKTKHPSGVAFYLKTKIIKWIRSRCIRSNIEHTRSRQEQPHTISKTPYSVTLPTKKEKQEKNEYQTYRKLWRWCSLLVLSFRAPFPKRFRFLQPANDEHRKTIGFGKHFKRAYTSRLNNRLLTN